MTIFLISILVLAFVFLKSRPASANSDEICETISDYLSEDNWKFNFDEDDKVFTFNLSIDGQLQHLGYMVFVRDDNYSVYAMAPIRADHEDEEIMSRIAEFICRANYGLRNGNFELDMSDGEIRYKVFVDCEDIIPSRHMIKNSILMSAAMFERYSPGFIKVMFKDANPEEAVEECES